MSNLSNNRALTSEELKKFESNYNITLQNDSLCIRSLSRDVSRLHPVNKKLVISPRNIRKLTITVEAIDMWKNYFVFSYSIFRIQNAMTNLNIQYIPCTYENVKIYLTSHNI
jgi:hypothetical protein